MSNINVLAVLLWSILFGIAGNSNEWNHARWPFLGGIMIFSTWVLAALAKAGGI